MGTGTGFATITSMHSARAFGAAVELSGGAAVLVAGGDVTDGPTSAELYDDHTGTWTTSEMTTARTWNTATPLSTGQVLVVGGDTQSDPATAEIYTRASNSWIKVFADLHSPRRGHTATQLTDGRVLVTGGMPATAGPALNTVEIFDPGEDPVNGSWTVLAPMNDARAFHTATLLPGGMVLVVGGLPDTSNSLVALSSAELFDPVTGTWTHTTPMNDTHAGHTASLLSFGPVQHLDGYVVLIAGGMGSFGSISSSAELYKPPPPITQPGPTAGTAPETASVAALATGSWVLTGQMNVPRMFHTATALPSVGSLHSDPQVLVAGGPDPGNEVTTGQTTEVFDLATGSWTLTGSMHSDRTGHLAAALEDGRVFVAGGLGGALGGPTDPVSSAEVATTCSSAAKLVVSPSQTIDFGQVHAGMQFNSALSLPTIQNTGNALLMLQATISGPDATLFGNNGAPIDLALGGTGSCLSGPPGDGAATPVFLQFAAWSPVARTCTATLTLGGSNAANTSPGQTWVFPMTAQIVLEPSDVAIDLTAPSFPQVVVVGDIETGQLVITLASQVSEAVSAVVRVPPPPANSAFHWDAGDHIVGIASTTVSVPVDFRPLGPGTATQTIQLISNAQGSPHLVTMHATAKKGIVQ